MGYAVTLRVGLPGGPVFAFFLDLERWFRLSPQWAVLSMGDCRNLHAGSTFDLMVRYDRTERDVAYRGVVERFTVGEALTIRLEGDVPRRISIDLREEGGVTALTYAEDSEGDVSLHEKREIGLWLKSIVNYLLIERKKTLRSRLYRHFIDRVWLRMSPFGRRITFFIVVGEALTFAFFILLLIGLLIFGKL